MKKNGEEKERKREESAGEKGGPDKREGRRRAEGWDESTSETWIYRTAKAKLG